MMFNRERSVLIRCILWFFLCCFYKIFSKIYIFLKYFGVIFFRKMEIKVEFGFCGRDCYIYGVDCRLGLRK